MITKIRKFEAESGALRRVENIGCALPLVFFCEEVTAAEVKEELNQ